MLLFQALVDELAHDQAVEHAHTAGFRRREDAEAHAHDDAQREKQRPEGLERLPADLAERCAAGAGRRVAALFGDDRHGDHQRHSHKQAGDVAGSKELTDGCAGDQTVDDEIDSGRDDGRDARGRRRDRGGKALAVAALFHLGHEQLALHGGVGVGRAGAAAHEHAQQDVDLRKAAGQMPGERVGKVHEPRADAAVVHDRAAHDEKRDRKERERLRGRDELLHQQVRHGRRVNKAEIGQRRGKERVGDRDAREIQHERDDDRQDRKERAHASTSPSSLLPLLRSLMKMTSE